ncbi:DUF4838 domain-containing protein [Paenibacillus koleovorans]|uniref:DUF4838 domain-containing protein n=1 Tax=Paenibacillus koleovorans TaxID=121608 RepID=UPI000FD7D787|nr:DUF4838 domain-containing protein [Paenibacillus koleovorans]
MKVGKADWFKLGVRLCGLLVVSLLFACLYPTSNASAAQVTLVQSGVAQATIVKSTLATANESKAATELQTGLQQITGATVPIVTNAGGVSGTIIYIGQAAPDAATSQTAITLGGDDPASFRLLINSGVLQLVGLSDQGTLYAAYELLEQIGMRWFMPGDIGTVIPSAATVNVDEQDTIQHPGFATRLLQGVSFYPTNPDTPSTIDRREGEPWVSHLRLGGTDYGVHGFPCTSYTQATRPDLFLAREDGTPTSHLDVTKPDVLECVVNGSLAKLSANPSLKYISMGPKDGHPKFYTWNPDWDGDDIDAFTGLLSLSDRYVRFYNLVQERLASAGYPDVGVAFYVYSIYTQPPVRWEPNSKLLPIFAPITFDRLHSIGDPISWERNYLKDLIAGWKDLGVKTMYRGYLYNLADPGLPFSMLDHVRNEIPYYKQQNIEYLRIETLPAWAQQGPMLYLATKLMWNPELDVDATLDDYYTKFFGPSGAAMEEYFDLLQAAFTGVDHFTGNVYDFPHILTPAVMANLGAALEDAEGLAPLGSDYAARVNMIRVAYDFADEFLAMMSAINEFDFAAAKQHYDNADNLYLEALAHSPIILSPIGYSYLGRFWKDQAQQGYQRILNGNRIVAELPDEWSVMLFPNNAGDKIGLWKPELGTQSWMPLKTYSETWSDQGLRYYKGNAWYRTSILVSDAYDEGHPIKLWFSNIDESARVWMNGQALPLVTKGKLGVPWEFDATDAILFGQTNVIVVDVTNEILDELGTGGIMGPVMLWEEVTSTDMAAPTAPTGLSATAGSQIDLSWTASTDNIGVAGYHVYRNGVMIGTVTGVTYTDAGATANTAYSYTVKAFDAVGNLSASSNTVNAMIDTLAPSAPSGLSVTPVSGSQIDLSWTASTDNVGATGYKVYRDGVEAATVTTTTYSDIGLTASTTYSYTVKAFDAAGNLSAASAAAGATTYSPGTLFFDDFEDGIANGWTMPHGTWSVVADSGSLVYEALDAPAANSYTEAYTGNVAWTDYELEARIKPLSFAGDGSLRIFGRYQNSTNYYMFQYNHSQSKLYIQKRIGSTTTVLAQKAYTLSAGTVYTFRLVMNGSTLDFYIDGVKELTTTDTSLAAGKIGFYLKDTGVHIDDVRVAQ